MAAATDAQLNSRVRKLIVANWLDISLIRSRVARGVIHLQGHVQKLGEGAHERRQVEQSLRKLDDDLRALPGFRGAAYLFDNWARESTGAWRYLGREKEAGKKPLR
jgi:hypothetical protein